MSDMKRYEYKKLRGRIVEKYGTIKHFSEESGIPLQNVNNKLNSKGSSFSQKDIVEWCRVLCIPVEKIGVYFFC